MGLVIQQIWLVNKCDLSPHNPDKVGKYQFWVLDVFKFSWPLIFKWYIIYIGSLHYSLLIEDYTTNSEIQNKGKNTFNIFFNRKCTLGTWSWFGGSRSIILMESCTSGPSVRKKRQFMEVLNYYSINQDRFGDFKNNVLKYMTAFQIEKSLRTILSNAKHCNCTLLYLQVYIIIHVRGGKNKRDKLIELNYIHTCTCVYMCTCVSTQSNLLSITHKTQCQADATWIVII